MSEVPTNDSVEKKFSGLNNTDVLAIIACWAGVAAVTWFSKDGIVAIIAIVVAYYLAKLIILKKDK